MYQASTQTGHTAQIIQFPPTKSTPGRVLRRLEIEAQNYCAAADSASWYHQASIEAASKADSPV